MRINRVIVITQVFPPETHPTAVMVGELARHLVEKNWDVQIISGYPHHPKGVIYPEYTKHLWWREAIHGVNVLRTWHFIHPSRTIPIRSAVFTTQALSTAIGGILSVKPDVIIVYGPPLVGPNLGAMVAAIHRAKLVNVIYDIYPDIAVETGKVRNKFVIGAAKLAERLQYRSSDLTVVLSDGFKQTLIEKGVPEDHIAVIPVWLDPDQIRPLPRDNAWRREQGIPLEKFVVLYAGTIGVVSGATVVADAAALFKDQDNVLFLFVGEGEAKAEVERRAGEIGLENMRFLPFQPRKRLAEVQATADVGLVTLLPGRGRTSVPSKVQGYMAGGRAVIGSVDADSDTAKLISDSELGLVVEPNNPAALADAVAIMLKNKRSRREMGRRARSVLEERFSKAIVLERYEKVLRRVVTGLALQ